MKELQSKDIIVLFVNYNQKTVKKEREYSKIAAKQLNIQWKEYDLHDLHSITKTALIHSETEETEVQGRNTILIGLGSALAQTLKYNRLYIGIQSADVVYGDAQPKYFEHMKEAMRIAYGIDLYAPLLYKTKRDIIELATQLNVDLNLTYSCYFDENNPCGTCPSCKVRINAEKSFK